MAYTLVAIKNVSSPMKLATKRYGRVLIYLLFSLLFHRFFYHQDIGINLILTEIILIGGLFLFTPIAIKKLQPFLGIAFLLSLYGTLVVHSDLAVGVNIVFFFLLLANAWLPHNNLMTQWFGVFIGYYELLAGKRIKEDKKVRNRGVMFWVNFLAFPMLIIVLFLFLYSNSIPGFASFFNNLFRYLPEISLLSVLVVLLGYLLVVYAWGTNKSHVISSYYLDESQRRIKDPKLKGLDTGLRVEANQWTLTLGALSLLGFLALILDVRYIWFDNGMHEYDETQWAVRQGTAALIASIVASLFFALYVFRGNLMFYPENSWLKRLNTLWLSVNALLCVSLFIRTLEYISEFNLAYKRIGVLVFILCALFAIVSVYLRIRNRRNGAYVLRLNLNVLCVIFGMMSVVHWDRVIVNYNLKHAEAYMDYDFLFSRELSVVLEAPFTEEMKKMSIQGNRNFYWLRNRYGTISYEDYLKKRMDDVEQEKTDWPSWNFEIFRNKKAIVTFKKP